MRDQGLRHVEFSPPETFEEYRLFGPLGRGAMGQVYLAEDWLLKRPVAIKFIATSTPTKAARERFFTEARAIARLMHPNVVAIHRVGEVQGRPFLVSEYVRGNSLDKVKKPIETQMALRIGIDLARGLSAAHRKGVLHRDIKPANAVMASDGTTKLLDFGLAELLPDASADMFDANAFNELPSQLQYLPDTNAQRVDAETLDGSPKNTGKSTLDATVSVPRSDPRRGLDLVMRDVGQARTGAGLVGTPLYMAPEVFRQEAYTPRSDVYSLGAVLYELCAGRPPHDGDTVAELAKQVQSIPSSPLCDVAPDLDARLAAAIDRCLEREPSKRFASAEALREALERIDTEKAGSAIIPDGNPYRGLLPFEASHRAVFFGRGAEVRAILDRLLSQSFVVVTGDSGAGKSSLCRAGVLPAFAERHEGSVVMAVPALGRNPVERLAAALAQWIGEDESTVSNRLRAEPSEILRDVRRNVKSKAILFVDQLEELCTLAPIEEARTAAEALRALSDSSGAIRVLAAARSDFLGRLSSLPGLGDDLSSALFLLRPLSADALREIIVGPARAKGFSLESDSMVNTLVDEAQRAAGGLPLLEFALAELWDVRDPKTKTIPASALEAMGGVGGALALHADKILSALSPNQRLTARAILLELVTADGTRARLEEYEILENIAQTTSAKGVLDALVRGRLLVARQAEGGEGSAYEIAHEALLRGWDTLHGWLGQDAETRAKRQRLKRAAQEWQRLGQVRESLWNERQLQEVGALDETELDRGEVTFLAASKKDVRKRRFRRWGGIAALPVALGLTVAAMQIRAKVELDRRVGEHLQQARSTLETARQDGEQARRLRAEAFSQFDSGKHKDAETPWRDARKLAGLADSGYARACQSLETTLMLAGGHHDARGLLADALYERALLWDEQWKKEGLLELLQRLEAYDGSNERRRRWDAPARLSVVTSPPSAKVWISRYEAKEGKRTEGSREFWGMTPVKEKEVLQGSVVLTFEAAGKAPVRLPLLLGRGEAKQVDLKLPAAERVPEGYIYIPEGNFLVGTTEEEESRIRNERQPLHTTKTEAFLIAKYEVTFADWIAYLRALPEEERGKRTPRLKNEFHALDLIDEGGRYRVVLGPGRTNHTALEGEKIRFSGRRQRVEQDWLRMPVSGVSYQDAEVYVAWLSMTGKVPGARLCDAREWERAARGADNRVYPHGDRLDPDDANVDITYGRDPQGFGPDEVGSHPASMSPYGVADMAGNVWEWVTATFQRASPLARGGSYYQFASNARLLNFEKMEPRLRSSLIGVRVCATPQGG